MEEILNIHNGNESTNFREICALNLHQLCAAFRNVTYRCHIMICFNQQLLITPAIPHIRVYQPFFLFVFSIHSCQHPTKGSYVIRHMKEPMVHIFNSFKGYAISQYQQSIT